MALRVAEGDHLSERSERGKLPQHKTRALATLRKLKAPLGGWFGGDARGPRRGRSPITGPALLHAAQASQTSPDGETPCPQGSNDFFPAPGRRNRAPHRRPKFRRTAKRRARRAARAKGSSLAGEAHTPVPAGQQNQKMTARRTGAPNQPYANQHLTRHPAPISFHCGAS